MNAFPNTGSARGNGCNDGHETVGSLPGIPGHRPPPWEFLGELGASLGLAGIGVAPALPVTAAAAACYREWLAGGLHAGLGYAARNLQERLDPRQPRIHPRSAAVISLALPYGSGAHHDGIWRHVAAHARGTDYHLAVRRALWIVDTALRERFSAARSRRLVDTAPVMERYFASACGLGFIGRHGGLVIPGRGGRVVLGELVVADVPMPPAGPVAERFSGCGECRACLDACPTGALIEPGVLDCRLCLSFHSAENIDGPIPPMVASEMVMIFGCDTCTAACPLEKDAGCAIAPPDFRGPPELDPAGLVAMPDEAIARLIRGTALERGGVRAIRRNAMIISNRDPPCHAPEAVE